MKPINISLIRKVLKWIEADLRRLDMTDYSYTQEEFPKKKYAECGTKACMAGWTFLFQYPMKQWKAKSSADVNMHKIAQKLLGLTADEANDIFTGNGTCYEDPKKQLKALKKDINIVLAKRDMKQRV